MGNMRLLIVDDDVRARSALVILLCGRGYHVSTAEDTAAARALLEQAEFDLVLTEVQLPAANEPALLSMIARLPDRPAIVVLTGRPSLDSAIEAINARVDGYLIKPCEPQALINCLEAALDRRSSERRPLAILRDVRAQLSTLSSQIGAVTGQSSQLKLVEDREPEEGVLRIGALQIGLNRRAVMIDHTLLPVTPIEHKLLRCLAEADGQICNYSVLVEHIHGYHTSNEEAAALLKSHARNLRRKLPPGYLVTVRDTGYVLVDPKNQQLVSEELSPQHFLELGAVMASHGNLASD
jgi:DNA-binding response OmpR family regulator